MTVFLWSLGFLFSQRVGRWFREATVSQLREIFNEYWPCIHKALWCQLIGMFLGAFLLNRGDYALGFIVASSGFWFVALALIATRPHPSSFERFGVAVMPLLIFSVVYFLELHHGA